MLAHSAMNVVFMLSETINLGSVNLTAGKFPKGNYGDSYKSVKETSLSEKIKVERDKPHKRETQIW